MAKRITMWVAVFILSLGVGGCSVMESTYKKKVDEADTLGKELAQLQQKHKELTSENSMLKARIANLAAERDKLTADLGYAAGQRDKLADDNKNLEMMLEAKSDYLSQTIVELRSKIAVLENENGRLKQDIAGLQKAQEEKVEKVSKTYESLLEKMKGEIDQGQVTISELKGKLTVNIVDAILFDSGKAEVKPEGKAVLQKVVSILKDVKDKAIRIEGHTDDVQIGGALAKRYPTNWELSAARAINVTRHLQEQGLDPSLLSAVAYGENKPVADNSTPEGRAKNRRIEIILIPKE